MPLTTLYRMDHLAHVQALGASARLCRWYQVFATMPVTVGHIRVHRYLSVHPGAHSRSSPYAPQGAAPADARNHICA